MVATSQQTQFGARAGVASTNKACKRVGPMARKSLAVNVLKDRGSDRPQRAYDELISARPNCLDQFSIDDEDQFKQGLFRPVCGAKVSWTTQHLEETREKTGSDLSRERQLENALLLACSRQIYCAEGPCQKCPCISLAYYNAGHLWLQSA